jgi:tRNA nucleotidyltransferase/poly(A) polymerase
MDGSAEQLFERLQAQFPELSRVGEATFLVGGAIRDFLIGRTPVDVDLTCRDARSEALRFAAAIDGTFVDLGREVFPTFRVVRESHVFDFSELSGSSIESDLGRRDFTINAIAVAARNGNIIIDPFGGTGDLRAGLVRMISERNLAEDPLRIVKGIRTAALYGFAIDRETLEAFLRNAGAISFVAAERVSTELGRMFDSGGAGRGLRLLHESQADRIVLDRDLDEESIRQVESVAVPDRILVFALLLRRRSDAEIDAFASRWRWSELQRRKVHRLLETTGLVEAADPAALRVVLYEAGEETAGRLTGFFHATGRDDLEGRIACELAAHPSLFSQRLLLTGYEIQNLLAMPPGPVIGLVKRALLEAQLAGSVRTHDEAVAFIKKNRNPL